MTFNDQLKFKNYISHQVEDTTMVVLLKELVLSLDLFVGDELWLVPEVGTALLLRHTVQLLNLFSLLFLTICT